MEAVRSPRQTYPQFDPALFGKSSRKGFQAVSIQDITDKAGINRATFHAHFTDKYQLLTAAFNFFDKR
jgi:AcrR family transcriptional regulator